ncbi:MAG: DUF348 domain-containing protein [Anaerolineae bacterium]|nr:DUF348 domain-containing protein [Anaerolineae bacterium]
MTIQAKATNQNLKRVSPPPLFFTPQLRRALAVIAIFFALWAASFVFSRPATLIINDQPYTIRTHQRSVGDVLEKFGINLAPEDRVEPALDSPLTSNQTITIQLARPVTVEADGQTHQLLTHHQNLRTIFADLGLDLNSRDEILVNGETVSLGNTLPQSQPPTNFEATNRLFAAITPRGTALTARPERAKIIVHRAVPITLNEGEGRQTFRTTKLTVGEALFEQGHTVYLGDDVTPPLDTPLRPNMTIAIDRATPIVIFADGRNLKTRTQGRTVSEILALENIPLVGQDYTRPALDHEVLPNDVIEIVRVYESLEIEAEYIPFETEWIADDAMELDQQKIRQAGNIGVIKSRTRVRYENNQEVAREFEDEWLDQTANTRVIAYGTQVVVRTLDTPDGTIEYWRKIPMLATGYSAATSGKALDHPNYGITRTGMEAGYGIVAVDPKVVSLRSNVYVPDYGVAVAGDTGGSILGKHIDLGFDDDKPLPFIYEWRDVYVLTPVPNSANIRYVLPQWPQRP